MKISVAIIIFIILFCTYLAVIASNGFANAHEGPIRIGDAGYNLYRPNHA